MVISFLSFRYVGHGVLERQDTVIGLYDVTYIILHVVKTKFHQQICMVNR